MTTHVKPISLLIIYTGGTIGMVRDRQSGVLHPFPFENILDEIPELRKAGFHLSSYTFSPPLDSSNISPDTWIKLSKLIEENYCRFDGFIVLHGTDTMAYSASALSFMLENLAKPVVFTGSQLPIGSLRTDAKENLITAIEIAASVRDDKPAVPEVTVFFQNKLFRGNRTIKHNAEEFKAFQSYNYPVLAETGVHIRFNYPAIHYPANKARFSIHTALDTNVTILKLYPGINPHIINAVLKIENLRAVVLETFGAGNAPNEKWFLREIEDAIHRDIIVLSVTQCAEGCVEMGMYETSKTLEKIGVISGHDITTEAAVTKLMYLLGKYAQSTQVRKDLTRSLRGEISIR
jgi:L-asparaginase